MRKRFGRIKRGDDLHTEYSKITYKKTGENIEIITEGKFTIPVIIYHYFKKREIKKMFKIKEKYGLR